MTTEPATEQLTPERLADVIAEYALDKKAQDVVELDLRGRVGLHGRVRALHRHERPAGQGDPRRDPHRAEERPRPAAAARRGPHRVPLGPHGLLDVVVHVFTPEARDFYRLESLWGDVPKRTFEAGPDGVDAA